MVTCKRYRDTCKFSKMKSVHFLFVIFWMMSSCGVSLTWSSSINSMFSVRNMISRTVGVNPELIDSIASGAQMAMDHCRNIFKWDRWNCPESAFSRRRKQSATREQAVTQAIVSAGLVHAVTRNCSRGELQGCACNPNLSGHTRNIPNSGSYMSSNGYVKEQKIDWSWGGCSDDIEFGQTIAKTVLDGLERGSDPLTFANLQNNLVGRTLVRDTMVKRCRCHGVSGSCSLQTCWMQVAPFSQIASLLRERHKRAVKINFENRRNLFTVGNSPSMEITAKKFPGINPHQLVFLDNSPDYCVSNNTTDWPGTKGRMCSRSRLETVSLVEKRSCRNLCRKCGYKVRKQKRQLTWKCNCSFKWCCEVQCETCTQTVEEFFCQ